MRKGASVTWWTGRSSSRPFSWPMRNSPPGIATRSFGFGLIFQNVELQLAFVRVNAVEDDARFIADRKLAAGALADDLADVLLISVLVAPQRVDRDQAF